MRARVSRGGEAGCRNHPGGCGSLCGPRSRATGAENGHPDTGSFSPVLRSSRRAKIIAENPFSHMRRLSARPNHERIVYVPVADVLRVMDPCPNPEWRALFALARFAGLRIPSEIVPLAWEHVVVGYETCSAISVSRCGAMKMRVAPRVAQPAEYPQRDSNPRLLAENQVSSAARRWGHVPTSCDY